MLLGLVIAGIAFLPVPVLYFRLKNYVAKEKVHAVEDLSALWSVERPPKNTLTDSGHRFRRRANASFLVILVIVGMIIAITSFFGSSGRGILSSILVAAVLAANYFESRLKHHVSKEKLSAIEDMSRLWPIAGPPASVLNDKGMRLYRYMRMSAAVFFIGIGTVFVGIVTYGIPGPADMWLGANP